jgi:hypothetical protein
MTPNQPRKETAVGLFELYRIYRYWGNSRRVSFRRAWRRWRGVTLW